NQVLGYLKDSNNQVLHSFSILSPDTTLTLSSGTYYLEVDLGNLEPWNYDVYLDAYTESTKYRDYEIVGGNRIKEIKNYDSDGQEIGYKKFVYTENGYETGAATGSGGGSVKQYDTRGMYIHEDTGGDAEYVKYAYWTKREVSCLVRKSSPIYTYG